MEKLQTLGEDKEISKERWDILQHLKYKTKSQNKNLLKKSLTRTHSELFEERSFSQVEASTPYWLINTTTRKYPSKKSN